MSASLILQIPSTPSSVTLRTQPANITVQKESAETVLVGVAGPAGPTGPTGPTGVIAATDPIVYTSGTQTVSANTTSLRTLSRQAATNPLRRWQQAFADARYGLIYGLNGNTQRSADVLVIGDSITEGYGSSTSGAGTTYVRRFAQLLAETANTDGRTGTYIACSTFDGLIPGPKWTIGAGSPTEQTFGLGRRGQSIPAGGDMRLTVTGTSATVFYRRVKIFPVPYNNGAIRIRAYAGTGIGGTLLFDRTEDTFDNALNPGAHIVVAQQIPVAAWGARGTVTLRITQETSSDGKTGGVLCEGAYIHDGTETIGTRVWASGKTGSAFATWNDNFDASLNDDWAAVMRSHYTIADASAAPVLNTAVGYLNPSLVVVALGSNETSTTPAAIKTAMGSLVNNIESTPGGTNTLPSFAFMVNPTNGTKTDAYWAPIVTAMYEKAEELGCAIWDWSSLFGPYSTITTDPYGWSADNLHPNNPGHIALGDFVAQQALAGVSSVTGTEGLINSISATAPATFDSTTRTIAVTTGTGLTTSSGALVPDFGTTSGKVTQGNDSRLDAATKLVTNATTTQIVSTTAKTAFLTQSIGPVTAGDVYLLTAFGDFLQQSGGAATYTIEFALGTTTLGTSNLLSFASAGTRRKWHLELQLICGTTSAQTIGGLFTTGGLSGAVTLPLVAPSASAPLTYTATEDMSSAKNLVWSVTMSANSASMDWRTLGYTLRRLR